MLSIFNKFVIPSISREGMSRAERCVELRGQL